VAGIDVIADDVARPLEEQGGVVIEVNAGPGLQPHVAPKRGAPRPVGEMILATLFPQDQNGRIPLVSVIGRSGATAATKLIAHLLSRTWRMVGCASAEGAEVGSSRIAQGDCRDAQSTHGVLLHPLTEAAVLEASEQQILTEGLAFDHCDVAVITDMGEGVKLDLEECETDHKRSLVYRAASDVVLPSGAVVLAVGEPLGHLIIENCPGSVILFSSVEDHPELAAHRDQGGRGVFARLRELVLAEGSYEVSLSLASAVEPSPSLLAAAAAAWALGIAHAEIAAGLQSYTAIAETR
jgi:cyanophycin synthetase